MDPTEFFEKYLLIEILAERLQANSRCLNER